jgi:DNA-directed RNA polymerase subunit M/transcription elongation factor TFIIS
MKDCILLIENYNGYPIYVSTINGLFIVKTDKFTKMSFNLSIIKDFIDNFLIFIVESKESVIYVNKIIKSNFNVKNKIETKCKKCDREMKLSQAFQNKLVSHNDYGDDAGNRGTTQSHIGEAVLVTVLKCEDCGHSFKIT